MEVIVEHVESVIMELAMSHMQEIARVVIALVMKGIAKNGQQVEVVMIHNNGVVSPLCKMAKFVVM